MRIFGGKNVVTVEIKANVQWFMAHDPTSATYIGVCPQLNLNAIGDTWTELRENVEETLQLLFEDLLETGELDAFLPNNGWAVVNLPEPGRKVRFDVPFGIDLRRPVQELALA